MQLDRDAVQRTRGVHVGCYLEALTGLIHAIEHIRPIVYHFKAVVGRAGNGSKFWSIAFSSFNPGRFATSQCDLLFSLQPQRQYTYAWSWLQVTNGIMLGGLSQLKGRSSTRFGVWTPHFDKTAVHKTGTPAVHRSWKGSTDEPPGVLMPRTKSGRK